MPLPTLFIYDHGSALGADDCSTSGLIGLGCTILICTTVVFMFILILWPPRLLHLAGREMTCNFINVSRCLGEMPCTLLFPDPALEHRPGDATAFVAPDV